MPPRFVYWTILIDDKPTAFRAHDRAELVPTFVQLKRTNANIVMKYFARGRLWETPEQAEWAAHHPARTEKRGADWRPGGQHTDPRARFKKRPDRPGEKAGSDRVRRGTGVSSGTGRNGSGGSGGSGGSAAARRPAPSRRRDDHHGKPPRRHRS